MKAQSRLIYIVILLGITHSSYLDARTHKHRHITNLKISLDYAIKEFAAALENKSWQTAENIINQLRDIEQEELATLFNTDLMIAKGENGDSEIIFPNNYAQSSQVATEQQPLKLEARISNLSDENRKLQTFIDKSTVMVTRNNEAIDIIGTLNEQLTTANTLVQKAHEEHEGQQQQTTELHLMLTKAGTELHQLQTENEDLVKTNDSLAADQKQIQIALDEAEKQQIAHTNLSAEHDELTTHLIQTESRLQDSKVVCEIRDEEIRNLQEKLAVTLQEHKQIEQKYAELSTEKGAYADQLGLSKQYAQQQSEELERAQQECLIIQNENQKFAKQISTMHVTVEGQEDIIASVEQQLQENFEQWTAKFAEQENQSAQRYSAQTNEWQSKFLQAETTIKTVIENSKKSIEKIAQRAEQVITELIKEKNQGEEFRQELEGQLTVACRDVTRKEQERLKNREEWSLEKEQLIEINQDNVRLVTEVTTNEMLTLQEKLTRSEEREREARFQLKKQLEIQVAQLS